MCKKKFIEEIKSSDITSLTDSIFQSNQPVVFRGLVNNWPLVKEGLISNNAASRYLHCFYNQKAVQAFVAPPEVNGRYFYNNDLSGFNFDVEYTSLTDVLNRILTEPKIIEPKLEPEKTYKSLTSAIYMGSTSVDHILPGFRSENPLAPLDNKPLINMWIGNQSRIAAHYDNPNNIACVAVGKRRFTLFPPNQLENLYVGPLDFTPAGQPASLVDFHQPDFKKYPKFKTALTSAVYAELEAGDAIFIPSMWWHHVEGLSSLNILINYWWRQQGAYHATPQDALTHALLSIRDLPESERDAWKNIFDHYVFSAKENTHIPQEQQGILTAQNSDSALKARAMLLKHLNR